MTDAKPFITLLKRATKSKYRVLLMNNRMFTQCYDLDVDSDVGLHYILPIPDTEVYKDSFYDLTLLLSLPDVISTYNMAHKKADTFRKDHKLKPKDLVEEVCFRNQELVFSFHVADLYIDTVTVSTTVPDDLDPVVMNITKHYNLLLERIKPGGCCFDIDGIYHGLQDRVTRVPRIYFYILKYDGKKIRVPLFRSMFLGIKDLDAFRFTIQETLISDDTFVYTYKLAKAGIEEIFWGYIVNY